MIYRVSQTSWKISHFNSIVVQSVELCVFSRNVKKFIHDFHRENKEQFSFNFWAFEFLVLTSL